VRGAAQLPRGGGAARRGAAAAAAATAEDRDPFLSAEATAAAAKTQGAVLADREWSKGRELWVERMMFGGDAFSDAPPTLKRVPRDKLPISARARTLLYQVGPLQGTGYTFSVGSHRIFPLCHHEEFATLCTFFFQKPTGFSRGRLAENTGAMVGQKTYPGLAPARAGRALQATPPRPGCCDARAGWVRCRWVTGRGAFRWRGLGWARPNGKDGSTYGIIYQSESHTSTSYNNCNIGQWVSYSFI
jgi:hypothetical protein